MSDPRINRLVKAFLHELFEHYAEFREPMAARSLQHRFATDIYRVFGPEFSCSRFVSWMRDYGLVEVLRKRSGGRFLLPTALWNEFPESEKERIRALVPKLSTTDP